MPQMLRYRQADRAAGRVIDGAAFVVAVDQHRLLELNELGTFIWQNLKTPSSLEQLSAVISTEFEVAPGTALADAESFLSLLVERGVVVAEDDALG